MEQKQLDEIDESYFGEEFIDEEEIKIEDVKPKKKAAKKATKTTKTTKKALQEDVVISEVKPDDVKVEIIEDEPVKPVKEDGKKEDLKKEELKKETPKEVVKPVEMEPVKPIDPWADDMKEQESSMSDAGTWKALTGILIVLLILSVFTSGFQFGDTPAARNDGLTIAQAEKQVLAYVNANLLRPPFSAEVETSADLGSVFQVQLNVAGQSIDSYLTKDGQYFFPQGFDVDAQPATPPAGEPVVAPPVEEPVVTPPVEEPVVAPPVEEPVVTPPAANAQEVSVSSRKWVFTPDTLRVKAGQPVVLTVLPDNTQASFVLPDYTFSIEGQGVSRQITQRSTIEFTPSQPGMFTFTCASCEEWRGMTGTLVVE